MNRLKNNPTTNFQVPGIHKLLSLKTINPATAPAIVITKIGRINQNLPHSGSGLSTPEINKRTKHKFIKAPIVINDTDEVNGLRAGDEF